MSGWLGCYFISPSVDYNHSQTLMQRSKGFFSPCYSVTFLWTSTNTAKSFQVLYLNTPCFSQCNTKTVHGWYKSPEKCEFTWIYLSIKDGVMNQYFIAQRLITSLMYSQEACMMLSSAVNDWTVDICSFHASCFEWLTPTPLLSIQTIPSILNSCFWPLTTELLEKRWHTIWLIL